MSQSGAGSALGADICAELREALQTHAPPVAAWLTAQVRATVAQATILAAAGVQHPQPPPEAPPSRLLTPEETAALLRVPIRWVRRHAREMPRRRLGKYLRFSEREVLEWYDRRSR